MQETWTRAAAGDMDGVGVDATPKEATADRVLNNLAKNVGIYVVSEFIGDEVWGCLVLALQGRACPRVSS